MATEDVSPERSLEESVTLEELRRRERELADFIENASVGLHWVGADGTILWANQAELDLLGYTREEYVGRKINEFHADRDVINDILHRLTNRETLHNYEARLKCKDGSVRHVLINSNVMWEEDRFVHTRCFTRDITERKRAEEELRESRSQLEELLKREQSARAEAEQANRLKDEFLATVSHELRTPLTAMLGWAHMLRVKRFDEQSAANALETIERNAHAQAQLIDDLLDVSRIITGKLRLDVRQVEPGSFIEAAVESLRPAAEAKGVRIQKVVDTAAWLRRGRPGAPATGGLEPAVQRHQVHAKGGSVQVRLERVDSHVEIAVSDTGAGIEPEFLPHVFERFRQADAEDDAQSRRARSGAGNRAPSGRASRRHGRGRQSGRRAGSNVRREAPGGCGLSEGDARGARSSGGRRRAPRLRLSGKIGRAEGARG